MKAGGLPIWVLYDHPHDHPHGYIARRWIGDQPTNETISSRDVEQVRNALAMMGLVKLMRNAGDDPAILESWL